MSSLTYAGGAIYADAASKTIRCTVAVAGRDGVTPYLAADGDATSQALYDALKSGALGTVAAYVAPTPTISQLRAYANGRLDALLAATRSYAPASGLNVLCDATTATGVNLQGLIVWAANNPTASTSWVDNNGGVVTLTAAQATTLAGAVLAYAQSVYAVLASAMNGIANQTLATTAAIDGLSWPI